MVTSDYIDCTDDGLHGARVGGEDEKQSGHRSEVDTRQC